MTPKKWIIAGFTEGDPGLEDTICAVRFTNSLTMSNLYGICKDIRTTCPRAVAVAFIPWDKHTRLSSEGYRANLWTLYWNLLWMNGRYIPSTTIAIKRGDYRE